MPDGTCHGLMSSGAACGQVVIGRGNCSALGRIERIVVERGYVVSKGVPCLCELNKLSVTQAS